MTPFYHDQQLLQLRLAVLIYLNLCLVTRSLQITATGDGDGGVCSATLTTASPQAGEPIGNDCNLAQNSITTCVIKCNALPSCKISYEIGCDGSGQCFCRYCNELLGISVSGNSVFYLHNKEREIDVSGTVNLPEGLIVGQPLVLKAVLISPLTSFYFLTSSGHQVFTTIFGFSNMKVHSAWQEGSRIFYEPESDFDFADGQVAKMMYIVTQGGYQLYLDDFPLFTFSHKRPATEISRFIYSSRQAGGLISFRL